MLEGRHLSVAFDGRPVLDDVSLAVASGERVQLAAVVRETAAELAAAHGDEPMTVVASGHISDDAGAQLRELEADKLIIRTVYPVVPPKVEYQLSDFGRTIIPVLQAMCDWGGQYLQQDGICPAQTQNGKDLP